MAALDEGAKGTSDAAREPAYTKVNELIKQHVPMIPIAHGGSAVAFRADVTGAHSSPLTNEQFAVMQAGDRPQLVFSQNGEPGGLYCADETDGEALRACDQTMEGLYGYEIGGTAAIPVLADKCEANADFTTWTCTLKSGVTFHDGSSFDADDVVTSFAVQWDADQSAPQGPDGRLHLLLEPVRVPEPAGAEAVVRSVVDRDRPRPRRGRSLDTKEHVEGGPRGVLTG